MSMHGSDVRFWAAKRGMRIEDTFRAWRLAFFDPELRQPEPPCSADIVAGAWLNFSFRVHFPRFGSIQLIAQTFLRQHLQG
jgi:hypothetical protein